LAASDQKAHEIIEAQKEKTDKLAQALLLRETLTRDEVAELVA